MELVYLWVEEYKNIKKQGFNFSPRFECSYDEKTNKLTIDEKEDYVSIFPENINVTAIVGENGSGKSNILKSILQIDDFENDYIIVYRKDGENYYSSKIQNIDTEIKEEEQEEYLKNTITYIDYEHIDRHFRKYRTVEIDKECIINLLVYNKTECETFEISSFMYVPITIEITYKKPEDLINKYIDHVLKIHEELREYFNSLDDYSFHQFLIIEYIINEGINLLEIYKDIEKLEEFFNDKLEDLKKTHSKFVELKTTKSFNLIEEKKIKLYANKNYFHYFDYDLIDEKDRRYNDLSSGEQMIFGQLLQIYFYVCKKEKELLFLFDEPELTLHPQWQKQYLNEVITLLQNQEAKAHFLFTSHSPFLLSDLSKENVIFLSQYEKEDEEVKKDLQKIGNCKNITKETNINPFGANIHTLLSHGFFMDDGLMGEFAKGKIDNIIVNLKNENYNPSKEEKETLLKTLNLIGEEFLKEKLLDMYYKKFDDDFIKKQRKKYLLKQQEEIKKELENL